jgi:signal transduction histidine kinase
VDIASLLIERCLAALLIGPPKIEIQIVSQWATPKATRLHSDTSSKLQHRSIRKCVPGTPSAIDVAKDGWATYGRSSPLADPSKRGLPVRRDACAHRTSFAPVVAKGGGHTMIDMPHPGPTPDNPGTVSGSAAQPSAAPRNEADAVSGSNPASERLQSANRTVLEPDLAHMNRVGMMGQLAASLAHEITRPIASARNNALAALNFLDHQPPDLGEVREALGCLLADADRAGDIIDRIRDHIRKAPPRRERFDLNEAINEVIALAQSAITENGVAVQTRLADGLSAVQGDRVQVQQVLLNLVLNAVEAMGSVEAGPRELSISTEQNPASGVLVAVRDSGPGIDAENRERVFNVFYTTKSGGTGIGLSICRSIIDAHSGWLWAEANEPRGAAFRFTLPGAERSS